MIRFMRNIIKNCHPRLERGSKCNIVRRSPLKAGMTHQYSRGYSTLELLLATAVGSIVIAGSFSAYSVIGKQQKRVSAFSEVQSAGMPTLRIISRDLRMAGRVAMDANIEPVYGAIATPIVITDSGDACCDSIVITYDQDSTVNPKRCVITYSVAARTNPARNALFRNVSTPNGDLGDTCTGDSSTDLVTDYVDDFQAVGSDNDASGFPRLVDMSILLRSQSILPSNRTYTPPDQVVGNFNYSFTDNYHRDEFTMTVNIKNLRDD